MKKKSFVAAALAILFGVIAALVAQENSVIIKIVGGQRPKMAVPDFRGSGAAQNYMAAFNETLFGDLQTAGLFDMVPKGMYPLQVPQRPEDFRQPPRPGVSAGGLALSDWSSPPVNANFLATGYTAEQTGQIVLYGFLFDVVQPNIANAQVLGKRYFGSVDEAGGRKVAHEFAADILAHWGATSLYGSHIYFVSDRTGHPEIWSMDPDGSNQKQLTNFRSISIMPSVSPDGTKIAFTSYARGNPGIFILSTETGRRLPFYNQVASLNAQASFTPDGKQIVFASTASKDYAQLYVANLDGSNLRRISTSRAIDVEPKVNPKTGNEIVFVSGRSGPQQIYIMNFDGTGAERLTNGEGEASNPSWHPNGDVIAFAWTRGYATGNFNIFVMEVASRRFDQLTHSEGRNENPSWAPDGRHLVFMSTRSRSQQIYTMVADGTGVRQLTTQGRNKTPVWGK
jgi:TolB protein